MTAPAPRNHPAEDAHPAPTPAPVAVPEVGRAFRDAWLGSSRNSAEPWSALSSGSRRFYELAGLEFLATLTPRPEPVVAPLPSEAVRSEVEHAIEHALAKHRPVTDGRGDVRCCSCRLSFGIQHQENGTYESHRLRVLTDAVTDRLAPEDDEDTVRVPRPVVAYGPEHLTENAATADYLREMVKRVKLLQAGSNVTATVRKLLSDAADAVEALDGAQ